MHSCELALCGIDSYMAIIRRGQRGRGVAAGWISVAQCLSGVSMSSGLSSGRKEKSLCFSGRPDLRDFIRLRISPELPGPQYFSSLSHACRNAVCFELPSRPLEKPERVRCWISQVRGPSWWDWSTGGGWCRFFSALWTTGYSPCPRHHHQ